ncbi:type II toxin-antitoxin system HicA family toxin [Neiella marina]|uniref:type II toxin-antitoxin system HicA family toxin n=1 Tax=Neiella marina TaxID=508461 RepID=UPI00166E77BC|nr:type II toxin-antitoxin system HicA family toxin [Neiella marina]
MTSKELIELLEQHGCEFVRHGKGSHQIWYSPITNRKFPVSHPNKNIAAGTLRAIKRQAGI